MSPVRLNGSTSGYSELSAPAVAGNNTITLPTGNGTAGQVLTTNGSGALSWSNPVQTVSTNYIIWVAPDGSKIMQAWGTTAFNASGVASITFPVAFNNAPSVTASVLRGSTLSGYLMSTQTGTTTTTGVTIIGNYSTGGAILNLGANEAAAWIAIGGVN